MSLQNYQSRPEFTSKNQDDVANTKSPRMMKGVIEHDSNDEFDNTNGNTPIFDQEKFKLMSENQALQKTIEVLEDQLATAREADDNKCQLEQENQLLKDKLRVLQGQYFSLEEQYSELQQRLESKRVSDLYSNRMTIQQTSSNRSPFNMASHLLGTPTKPSQIDSQTQTTEDLSEQQQLMNVLVARKEKLKSKCKELHDRNQNLSTELSASRQKIKQAEKQLSDQNESLQSMKDRESLLNQTVCEQEYVIEKTERRQDRKYEQL